VAVKTVGFKHQVSIADISSSSGMAQGMAPSCVRKVDINTPLVALHELCANQAVAGNRHYAALLGHRISMSGVLFVFEVVGSGTPLSNAVYHQQQQQQQHSSQSSTMSPAAAGAGGAATLPPLLLDYCLRFIATAINTLHAAGWVNLDLKPDNLLLTNQLQPKVADLGTARQMGTLVGGVGTPLFWAPQVRGWDE
jgi:serine/threonine protein kinase